MLRIILICALVLSGCTRENREDAAESEEVPIGPGSDSSALIPRDTPMTSRMPTQQPGVRDTTMPPVTTR